MRREILFFYEEKRPDDVTMTLNIKLITRDKRKPSIIIRKFSISPSIIFTV